MASVNSSSDVVSNGDIFSTGDEHEQVITQVEQPAGLPCVTLEQLNTPCICTCCKFSSEDNYMSVTARIQILIIRHGFHDVFYLFQLMCLVV